MSALKVQTRILSAPSNKSLHKRFELSLFDLPCRDLASRDLRRSDLQWIVLYRVIEAESLNVHSYAR